MKEREHWMSRYLSTLEKWTQVSLSCKASMLNKYVSKTEIFRNVKFKNNKHISMDSLPNFFPRLFFSVEDLYTDNESENRNTVSYTSSAQCDIGDLQMAYNGLI